MYLRMISPAISRVGKRRLAGAVRVGLAERLLEERPVHLPRQLHQRMAHVDDLVQPRPEKIVLAALATLSWLHRNPLGKSPLRRENHKTNLQGIRRPDHIFRQIGSPRRSRFRFKFNSFGNLHSAATAASAMNCDSHFLRSLTLIRYSVSNSPRGTNASRAASSACRPRPSAADISRSSPIGRMRSRKK